jgi:hypothetical protein
MGILKEIGETEASEGVNDAEWVQTKKSSSIVVLRRVIASLSTFNAGLLSHCSSTVVYDVPFSSSESLLLSNVKNTISYFAT